MGNIENLHKDQDTYKIEGEAFERVRAASDLFDKHKAECDAAVSKLGEAMNGFRQDFWEVIYKEVGVNLGKEDWILKEYKKHRLYFIERDRCQGHPCIGGLLGMAEED